MKFSNLVLGLSVGAIALASCGEDDKPSLSIPSTYDGSNFNTNAATQLDLVDRLGDLTTEAKKGRDEANTVTSSALTTLFQEGTPSLEDEVTDYYKNKLTGTTGWFSDLAAASGKTWEPATPTDRDEGGTYGGYLFDENGLEIEQLIEKGQFNATLYNHATDLMTKTITLATCDQLVAVFGAKPAFANSGSSNASDDSRDRALANYGARRDKNDGNGMYTKIKKAFITLQAAVKEGDDFNTDRDNALKDIQELWEKINAATVINYCHTPVRVLSLSGLDEDQTGGALHAIAEGIGFLHGMKSIDANFRIITDAQIDEILTLFNAPAGGTPTVYKFATDAANEIKKLSQAIDKLQEIYNFSDQEIEDFKSNWVTTQNR